MKEPKREGRCDRDQVDTGFDRSCARDCSRSCGVDVLAVDGWPSPEGTGTYFVFASVTADKPLLEKSGFSTAASEAGFCGLNRESVGVDESLRSRPMVRAISAWISGTDAPRVSGNVKITKQNVAANTKPNGIKDAAPRCLWIEGKPIPTTKLKPQLTWHAMLCAVSTCRESNISATISQGMGPACGAWIGNCIV